MGRFQLPGSAAWSENQLTLSFPPIKHVVRPVVRCFEVLLQTMSNRIHASSKGLPPQRRHSCSSNPLTAPYRTPATLFYAFAGVVVSRIRICVCPPLCPTFAYYRLCDTFILLGLLSRIWNINLNAFSQKGSDVSELPFKPRLRTLECGGKQGTACHFRFTSLPAF
jgi:hypothetical protein